MSPILALALIPYIGGFIAAWASGLWLVKCERDGWLSELAAFMVMGGIVAIGYCISLAATVVLLMYGFG